MRSCHFAYFFSQTCSDIGTVEMIMSHDLKPFPHKNRIFENKYYLIPIQIY